MDYALKNQMIELLGELKEGFNPSSPTDLQALLYLIYFDYEVLHHSDEIYSQTLMQMVEVCKAASMTAMLDDAPPMDRPPMDRPPMDRPPMDRPPMDRPPMDRPPMDCPDCRDGRFPPREGKNPIEEFTCFGMRKLFFDQQNQRIPKDIFGFELR